MGKVTSKYQITLPKRIADEYDIHPGDDIGWVASGESIRVIPPGRGIALESREMRLYWFDRATERQKKRGSRVTGKVPGLRGWKREDLYGRGRSR